jgi:hypothetical protein
LTLNLFTEQIEASFEELGVVDHLHDVKGEGLGLVLRAQFVSLLGYLLLVRLCLDVHYPGLVQIGPIDLIF